MLDIGVRAAIASRPWEDDREQRSAGSRITCSIGRTPRLLISDCFQADRGGPGVLLDPDGSKKVPGTFVVPSFRRLLMRVGLDLLAVDAQISAPFTDATRS